MKPLASPCTCCLLQRREPLGGEGRVEGNGGLPAVLGGAWGWMVRAGGIGRESAPGSALHLGKGGQCHPTCLSRSRGVNVLELPEELWFSEAVGLPLSLRPLPPGPGLDACAQRRGRA